MDISYHVLRFFQSDSIQPTANRWPNNPIWLKSLSGLFLPQDEYKEGINGIRVH